RRGNQWRQQLPLRRTSSLWEHRPLCVFAATNREGSDLRRGRKQWGWWTELSAQTARRPGGWGHPPLRESPQINHVGTAALGCLARAVFARATLCLVGRPNLHKKLRL